MTTTEFLAGIALAWIVTGFALGYLMARRGHDFFVWLALGAILGPLAIPLAFQNIGSETKVDPTTMDRHVTTGDLDVLVAIDGSPEATAALIAAVPLIGKEPTSVTVVTVLDYEASSPLATEERDQAQQMLDEAVSGVDAELSTEILYGDPKRVIADYARETGKDLIVIGARGNGASQAIFGSVARAIVSGCKTPVLVGPQA